MADVNILVPIILKWEGKFSNHPDDAGGPTFMGVTLRTLIKAGIDKNNDGKIDLKDLKALSKEDVIDRIFKPLFWDSWQADRIRNQSVANLLVDWVWMSGGYGILFPQRMLGLKEDGIVGEKTLRAINQYPDQKALFQKIKHDRELFIDEICENRKKNESFRKGWLNRLADFKFSGVVLLFMVFFGTTGCKSVAGPVIPVSKTSETSENVLDSVAIQSESISHTNRDYFSEEILDELYVIENDSCQTVNELLNNKNGQLKKIVHRQSKRMIQKGDISEKSAATNSLSKKNQIIEKNQLSEVSKKKTVNQDIIIAVVICIILFIAIVIDKFSKHSSK